MSFQPVIPAGGNLGWTLLQNSRQSQQEAFNTSTQIKTNTDYFRENIGKISTAEELVADRRLFSVALGAYGLGDDINNRFFVQKVLEEGTLNQDSFANRLADKRYFQMSAAFGFDLQPPNTALSDFADKVTSLYEERQFEVAVGDQDGNLRLALGFDREIEQIATSDVSEETAWFQVMANPALRSVFEGALGLPSEIGAVDIDQQLREFRTKSEAVFGTSNPSSFANSELQEELVRKFLVRAELSGNTSLTSAGTVALTLLQAIQPQN